MQTCSVLTRSGAAVAAAMALVAVAQGRPLAGLWDGEIKYDDLTVEFPMELSGSGHDVKGSFLNGDERVASTSGIQTGNSLVLDFADYAARLSVTEEGGVPSDVLHRSRWQGAHYSYGLRGSGQRGLPYAAAAGIRRYGGASAAGRVAPQRVTGSKGSVRGFRPSWLE